VRGELTIRGITQPVRLVVDVFGRASDVLGNPRLGLKAKAKAQRAVWGIMWNAPVPGGGVALGQEVDLELDPLGPSLPRRRQGRDERRHSESDCQRGGPTTADRQRVTAGSGPWWKSVRVRCAAITGSRKQTRERQRRSTGATCR
jgi:hypothetical protein